jgi:hypothetical protein
VPVRPAGDGGIDGVGWSSGAMWPAGSQWTASMAAMSAAHHPAISDPISNVGT